MHENAACWHWAIAVAPYGVSHSKNRTVKGDSAQNVSKCWMCVAFKNIYSITILHCVKVLCSYKSRINLSTKNFFQLLYMFRLSTANCVLPVRVQSATPPAVSRSLQHIFRLNHIFRNQSVAAGGTQCIVPVRPCRDIPAVFVCNIVLVF